MKNRIVTLSLLAVMALPALAVAQTDSRQALMDQKTTELVAAQIQKKDKFRAVTATVADGIVTLNGEVPLHIDKVNVEKSVRKVKEVDGVRNHVQVGGPVIPDAEIQENLSQKLRYDRVGYGIVFNNLAVGVTNGVAKVSGNVRDYPDRDSALAILSTTAGVKEVIDEISVAPASMFDDRLRIQLAHSIYDYPALKKYAVDPQAPIRIVVTNGNVELTGVVLTNLDRQLAFTQANSVPGVFSVTNHIAVASEVTE